uniref:Isoleucine--tRNA ligase n=1 Tax=Anthurium amnicola TaxID=1678845 RepID=A0A1D1Z8X0_9ARAE
MAAKNGFEDFKPMFGEAMAERAPVPAAAAPSTLPRPFLFYVHALDPYRLEVVATDFSSHTLERVFTVQDLEDLRDETGVGSSSSEFVDYLVASLSSDDVKLVLGGATKLVAHKSKGMPRVSLSLNMLVGSSVNDVMGNLSLALYGAFKEKNGEVVKGCGVFFN